MAHRSFEVILTPDGSGWHARIPKVKGCHTWGRGIAEVRRNIREALSICDDVLGSSAEQIAKNAHFVERVPADVRAVVRAYAAARKRLGAAQVTAKLEGRKAATALLKDIRVSVRDAGELLGLSGERVRILAAAAPSARRAAKIGKKAPAKRRAAHA